MTKEQLVAREIWRRAVVAAAVVLLAGSCGSDGDDARKAAPKSAPVAAGSTVTCTPTAAAADEVEIRARWAPGDVRSFTITNSRDDSRSPSTAGVTGTAPLELRVLEAGPGRARLRWESGKALVDTASLQLGREEQQLFEEFADLSRFAIEYSTDEWGAFNQVENRDELRGQAERIVAKLEEVADGTPEMAQVVEATRRLFLSDVFLDAVLVEDTLAFHFVYGFALSPGHPETFAYELPNPFGGEPFPATASVDLVSPKDADGCVVVETVITPDPDQVARILSESLAEQFGTGGLDDSALRGFDLQNTLRFVHDPTSGWMVRVEMEKVIRAEGRSRIDRTVIEAR